ncbi:hypothetical protein NE237_025443 [Protea cynaroides]|uniref:RecA family profile 1 domain-containing protein n=1 Tax=Protea cynaroides TaxID=273540 RepID=A0A9Q0H689_9MAGN|nr:hypothetical protein NE237_025443 [Protea cynaroides]
MKPENPLHLLSQKCPTGCPIIDRVLSGGIPCNSITELVGESGCGKTQLCLQLLLSAQLPISHGGLRASSLFIHSEFPFPLRRLKQLSLSFCSSHPHLLPYQDPCDFIFVRAVQSAEELLVLFDRIDALLTCPPSKLPVKLIVIDSIAALFRSEFENTPADLKRRYSLFFRISGKLKLQAKRRVCPALGLAWANYVNSRLFLSRNDEIVSKDSGLVDGGDGGTDVVRTRKLQVVFAPHLPEAACNLFLTFRCLLVRAASVEQNPLGFCYAD